MCREHAFREDLFFRLMVLSLEIPPLRHRLAELPMMADAALSRICQRMGIPAKRLTTNGLAVLLKHSWPGNIRELENVLERAAAFSAGNDIGPEELVFTSFTSNRFGRIKIDNPQGTNNTTFDLNRPNPFLSQPANDRFTNPAAPSSLLPPPVEPSFTLAGQTLDAIEREAIRQTLTVCNGNKAKSARMLGISEKSIYNKMRRLKIDWPH